ncbi:MAG: hypothetical protein GY940_09010 [bacterium]|nr:hypothetical protein [bacterium]
MFRSSKAFEKRLKEAIKRIEEEYKMPYLASWEREAKKEGIKEGKKEGIDKEKERTAKEMLKDGLAIQSIMKYTGLSEKKIKELATKTH